MARGKPAIEVGLRKRTESPAARPRPLTLQRPSSRRWAVASMP